MIKRDPELIYSKNKLSGYYRLKSPKLSFLEKTEEFLEGIIKFPFRLYQAVVGRLLSYLIINPIFRKDEKDESLVLQHPKHPDPLFDIQDEMDIINVVPKENILIRVVLNWHNYLVNHTAAFSITFSIIKRIFSLLPQIEHSVDRHLDKLVEKIVHHIQQEKSKFKPNQIHFRGIEKLTAEQQNSFYKKLEERIGYDFRQNINQAYFYSLQTTDNAVLDSVELRGDNVANQEMSERRFIISCMPRSNNFVDWVKQYKYYAKELSATVIAFNYRGVGLSKGIVYNESNLHDDTYAQVQRLLKMGARPENISLMGECVGGNVASYTAGRLHQEGYRVKLYNARSFRSFISIIEGRTLPSKNDKLINPIGLLKWLRYVAFRFIFNPLIISAGWSLDVEQQILKINPEDFDFLVVRSKKNEEGKRFRDDAMIPHKEASIHRLIKEHVANINEKEQRGEIITPAETLWRDDSLKRHKFHVSEELMKERAKTANGHVVIPSLLTPSHPLPDDEKTDGRQYAINFFHRVWPESEKPVPTQSPSCK